MKKAIAGIIALTVIFGTFTGCGKNAAEDASDNTTTTKASQEVTTAETVETTTAEAAEESSYEELIKDFIDAYVANDRKKTLQMQYPDGYMDIVRVTMKGDDEDEMTINDSISEEEAVTYLQSELYRNYSEDEKVKFKGIVSAEPLEGAEADEIKQIWGIYKGLERYIKEHGGADSIDRYELDEIESDLMGDDLTDGSELEEGYFVTIELEDEKTGDVSQGFLNVFRMAGEGWKINAVDMEGNVISKKSESADVVAKSANRAMNTALVVMDEQIPEALYEIEEPYIVGSDDSMNLCIPECFDAEKFRKETANFYEEVNDMDWFAVITEGCVIYLAVDESEGVEPAGTYPPDSILSDFGGGGVFEENTEPKTLKELYDICADLVEKK